MAKLSVIAPYTKKGALTFLMPTDFSTPSEFIFFLNQNSFSSSADVTLVIENGTVISEPFILDGNYDYLTILVNPGDTAYVDSDNLPKYQPFPSQPTVLLPWFIYNRWLEYSFGGQDLPNYGIRAICGTFEKIGSQNATFMSLSTNSPIQLGLSVFSPSYGTEKVLNLVNFEQAGLISGSIVSGTLAVTCPTPVSYPITFGPYIAVSCQNTNGLAINPYGQISVLNSYNSFLNMSAWNTAEVSLVATATPFEISCPTFIYSNFGENVINAYVKPGSGGNLGNCFVSTTKEAYNVGEGILQMQSTVLIKTNLTSHNATDPIIGKVGLSSKLLFMSSFGSGVSQNLELDFDASLGPNGITPLFSFQSYSELIYPYDVNITVGPGGSNQNKIAIGGNGGTQVTHSFSTSGSLDIYYNQIQSVQLSAFDYMNVPYSRIKVMDADPSSIESYGRQVVISEADVLAGVVVGDISTRPTDLFCNGKIVLDTIGNLFYQTPSYLQIQTATLPHLAFVQKSGNGAIVDIDAWLAGSAAGTYLTSNMNWKVPDNLLTEKWNKSVHITPITGTNLLYSPSQQVNVVPTAVTAGADFDLNLNMRPGEVIRFLNTSNAHTVSGDFLLPSQSPVPYSLAPGASVTVTIGWDTGSSLRTLFVS